MGSKDNDQDGYWSYSYTKHLFHPHHKTNFYKVYFLTLFCHYFDFPSDERGSNQKSQNEAGLGSSSLEGDLYRPHSLCFSGCGADQVFLTTMGCLLKHVHTCRWVLHPVSGFSAILWDLGNNNSQAYWLTVLLKTVTVVHLTIISIPLILHEVSSFHVKFVQHGLIYLHENLFTLSYFVSSHFPQTLCLI